MNDHICCVHEELHRRDSSVSPCNPASPQALGLVVVFSMRNVSFGSYSISKVRNVN